MGERAKKKRTKEEHSRLWRRVLLIVGVATLIGGGFFAAQTYAPYIPDVGALFEKSNEQEPTIHEPSGVICASICVLVDEQGVAYQEIPRPEGNLLLTIDMPSRDLRIGERLITKEVLEELSFIQEQAAEELSVSLGRAAALDSAQNEFEFQTDDGWRLKLSVANNAYVTLGVLGRVLAELGDKRATLEYIDLRVENRVYYR